MIKQFTEKAKYAKRSKQSYLLSCSIGSPIDSSRRFDLKSKLFKWSMLLHQQIMFLDHCALWKINWLTTGFYDCNWGNSLRYLRVYVHDLKILVCGALLLNPTNSFILPVWSMLADSLSRLQNSNLELIIIITINFDYII